MVNAVPPGAPIEMVDDATPAEAIEALAPLFEGAPRFLARVVAVRPFEAWSRLFERAREIAHGMPEPEQVELIDAHPRLGAPAEAVSALSHREQGYEREGRNLAVELEALNDAYEARFGFRYCVFVAGRSRAALLPDMAASLDRDRGGELRRALDAVIDIAADRQRSLTSVAALSLASDQRKGGQP